MAELFLKNMKRGAVLAMGTLAALWMCACSSNNATPTGGDGGSTSTDSGAGQVYTVSNCPNGSTIRDTCATCLSSLCGPELDAVNTACTAAFACECPLGVDAAACPVASQACQSAAASAVSTCTSCTAVCGGNTVGDAGIGGDAGSGADATTGTDAGTGNDAATGNDASDASTGSMGDSGSEDAATDG